LTSETGQRSPTDEVFYSGILKRRSCNEVLIIVSSCHILKDEVIAKKTIFKKVFYELSPFYSSVAVEAFNQRNLMDEDWKCDPEAFNHVSTVGKPRGAAEQIISFQKKINGRQTRVTERSTVSIHGKICSDSEISPNSENEEFIAKKNESSPKLFLIHGPDVLDSFPYPVSSPKLCCAIPVDRWVGEFFDHHNSFVSFGMKHVSSGCEEVVIFDGFVTQFILQKNRLECRNWKNVYYSKCNMIEVVMVNNNLRTCTSSQMMQNCCGEQKILGPNGRPEWRNITWDYSTNKEKSPKHLVHELKIAWWNFHCFL
jgi:hypothetical protein